MAAEITFNQPSGAGPGVAGKARNDIWISQAVELVSSGTGSTYLWELLSAPPGSSAVITSPTSSPASITPDVIGTYRIQLTVDGGGVGNVYTRVIRARYDATGVILHRGWALPAVDEEEGEADYGTNDRHWDEVWQAVTTDMRGSLTHVLTFQPGGTAEGNTFTDWSLLMVAFGETSGEIAIVVDDTFGSVIIPTGAWDLESRGSVVGISSTQTSLQIATGGLIASPREIWHINASADATYQGGFLVADHCHVYDSVLTTTDASYSIMQVNTGGQVWLHGSNVTNGVGGASSVLTRGGGAGTAYLYLEGYSSIEDDTLGGTLNWDIYLDSVSTATNIQTNCSGTVTIYAPSSGTSTFVFQPGGTAGGNVYTDWSLLMADLAAVDGPKVIEFDTLLAGPGYGVIPSGTHALGRNTILRGKSGIIRMDAGAIFQDALRIEGTLEIWSASTSAIFTWTAGPRYLDLFDRVTMYGDTKDGAPPTSPLITSSVTLSLHDQCYLAATIGTQPIVETSSGTSRIRLFDGSGVIPGDGGGNDCAALNVTGVGAIEVEIFDQGVRYQNQAVTGLSTLFYSVQRMVIDVTKGIFSNALVTPVSCGAAYLSEKSIPKHLNATCKFRVLIETTSGSVGYEAYIDLFDTYGQLNAGVPAVVTGSQIDTGTGSSPTGAPTPNALLPGLYEVDLTSAIIGGTWVSDIAIFEARLWIGTAGGGNSATCKSAELIFEWTTEN